MLDKKKESDSSDGKGSKNTDKTQKLNNLLSQLLIDPKEKLIPPKMAWSMVNNAKKEEYILGTLGNFSLIIGKAKSKKSFFINIAISSAISEDLILGKFKSDLPDDQKQVLYFDTEQGKYHVQLALKRICVQVGIDEPGNLKVYGLRSLKPSERLDLIEHAIYTVPNVGFIVIDGIKDLVNSINSEEEATMISSKLLKWTEEKNIHIVCVLHQNKSDNNARGHIGTELINKAETVLSVTVDKDDKKISVVMPEMTRNLEPEPFAFKIDKRGLPVEVEGYSFIKEVKPKQKNLLLGLDEVDKFELLEEVYKNGKEFNYTELSIQVKLAFERLHKDNAAKNKVVEFITMCKNKGYLIQDKKRKPYTLVDPRPDSTLPETFNNDELPF